MAQVYEGNVPVTEYEMDEESEISEKEFLQGDMSENFEIELTDFTVEELESIEEEFKDSEEEVLKNLPVVTPKFVDDGDIPLVVTYSGSQERNAKKDPSKALVCQQCGKCYQKKIFFVKHISSCNVTNIQDNSSAPATSSGKSMAKKKKPEKANHFTTTNEELLAEKNNLIKNAIEQVRDDEFNVMEIGTKKTPGNLVSEFARKLLLDMEESNILLENVSRESIQSVGEIVLSTTFNNVTSREIMWTSINKVAQIDRAPESLAKYFSEVSISSTGVHSSFYHQFCMELVYRIIKAENEKSATTETAQNVKLTKEDEQVIYYVSGFLVFAFLKKYRSILRNNPNNKAAADSIRFFQSLKANTDVELTGNSFEEYVMKWIKLVDRGFLVKVNDEMYSFVKEIELSVSKVMTVRNFIKFRSNDMRELVEEELKTNVSVNRLWDALAKDLPNQNLGNLLKKQITTKWIDIRAKAFVNAYVQLLKKKATHGKRSQRSISTAAEPSLRATLH